MTPGDLGVWMDKARGGPCTLPPLTPCLHSQYRQLPETQAKSTESNLFTAHNGLFEQPPIDTAERKSVKALRVNGRGEGGWGIPFPDIVSNRRAYSKPHVP